MVSQPRLWCRSTHSDLLLQTDAAENCQQPLNVLFVKKNDDFLLCFKCLAVFDDFSFTKKGARRESTGNWDDDDEDEAGLTDWWKHLCGKTLPPCGDHFYRSQWLNPPLTLYGLRFLTTRFLKAAALKRLEIKGNCDPSFMKVVNLVDPCLPHLWGGWNPRPLRPVTLWGKFSPIKDLNQNIFSCWIFWLIFSKFHSNIFLLNTYW